MTGYDIRLGSIVKRASSHSAARVIGIPSADKVTILNLCPKMVTNLEKNQIEPYPLCERVLQLNGWQGYGAMWLKGRICVDLLNERVHIGDETFKNITAVHELQNIMLTFGMTEAWDFIVDAYRV